jgi:hypothetical protein
MGKRSSIIIGGLCVCIVIFSISLVSGSGMMIVEEMTGQNIHFMTGGVGIEERKAMKEKAKGVYNLKLVFAMINGDYLSGVDVRIKDANGNLIIDETSNGPWFYVDLPAGRYEISAVYKERRKSRRIMAGKTGLTTVMFHWKS